MLVSSVLCHGHRKPRNVEFRVTLISHFRDFSALLHGHGICQQHCIQPVAACFYLHRSYLLPVTVTFACLPGLQALLARRLSHGHVQRFSRHWLQVLQQGSPANLPPVLMFLFFSYSVLVYPGCKHVNKTSVSRWVTVGVFTVLVCMYNRPPDQPSLQISAGPEMSIDQRAGFCGREGNRRSGVALAVRHKLCAT